MNYPSDIQAQLDRCDREIKEMKNQEEDKPAWLVTLGINDWEMEKNMLLNKHVPALGKLMDPTVARERSSEESNALEVGSGLVGGAKTAQAGS